MHFSYTCTGVCVRVIGTCNAWCSAFSVLGLLPDDAHPSPSVQTLTIILLHDATRWWSCSIPAFAIRLSPSITLSRYWVELLERVLHPYIRSAQYYMHLIFRLGAYVPLELWAVRWVYMTTKKVNPRRVLFGYIRMSHLKQIIDAMSCTTACCPYPNPTSHSSSTTPIGWLDLSLGSGFFYSVKWLHFSYVSQRRLFILQVASFTFFLSLPDAVVVFMFPLHHFLGQTTLNCHATISHADGGLQPIHVRFHFLSVYVALAIYDMGNVPSGFGASSVGDVYAISWCSGIRGWVGNKRTIRLGTQSVWECVS